MQQVQAPLQPVQAPVQPVQPLLQPMPTQFLTPGAAPPGSAISTPNGPAAPTRRSTAGEPFYKKPNSRPKSFNSTK